MNDELKALQQKVEVLESKLDWLYQHINVSPLNGITGETLEDFLYTSKNKASNPAEKRDLTH